RSESASAPFSPCTPAVSPSLPGHAPAECAAQSASAKNRPADPGTSPCRARRSRDPQTSPPCTPSPSPGRIPLPSSTATAPLQSSTADSVATSHRSSPVNSLFPFTIILLPPLQ